MDFFAAQDRSRRITRRLIFLYAIATLIIVVLVTAIIGIIASKTVAPANSIQQWLLINWPLLGGAAASTAGFIGLASTYKVARLSAGGSRVALDMGGTAVPTDVADPLRRRLRNVVEEMAIASGVPVPAIYVLEEENAINAFAAGFSPEDAAVAVTRGTLESLTRDELQGVIAHEFSHILNGDMRINIRLMGILFGILAIAMIGRLILRGTRHSGRRSSSNNRGGVAAGFALGLALFVIGYVGVFFGRLIKAGVSRQREFLADASAVQFTRQTDGLAGALKKIGGFDRGSTLNTDSEEISHMLFALGSTGLAGLFATHPPLDERIRALDASFKGSSGPRHSSPLGSQLGIDNIYESPIAPLTSQLTESQIDADKWVSASGQPDDAHIAFAGNLRRSVPELLGSAAHSRDQSLLLVIALVLDRDEVQRERQFQFLVSRLGELRNRRVRALFDEFSALGPAYRLPLLDLAFPALKDRPSTQINFLIDLIDSLIHLDGQVDLFEYAFARVLQGQLADAEVPRRKMVGKQLLRRREQQIAAQSLLAIFAYHGKESDQEGFAAYRCGLESLGINSSSSPDHLSVPADWVSRCDRALTTLNRLDAQGKRQVLTALIKVAAFDNGLNTAEAEMLRAIAAVLQIPLTPLLRHPESAKNKAT